MNDNLPVPFNPQPPIPRQAESDAQLVALFLHGRSRHTQRAYGTDINAFLNFVGGAIHSITLASLQNYFDKLSGDGLAPASMNRKLAAVKSLLSFAHKIGYLPFDVGRPVRLVAVRDTLAERILSEVEIQRMIALEQHPRNHAVLLCLYGSGVRVSELCGLRWRDLKERSDAGQITVFGKRGKTRSILLPATVWTAIIGLRDNAGDDDAVFKSRRGGVLHPSAVWRVVNKAARRAGIERNIGPHTCRHAHCSHSLQHGAALPLVRDTCGHASISTTSRYLHSVPGDSSGRYLPL